MGKRRGIGGEIAAARRSLAGFPALERRPADAESEGELRLRDTGPFAERSADVWRGEAASHGRKRKRVVEGAFGARLPSH